MIVNSIGSYGLNSTLNCKRTCRQNFEGGISSRLMHELSKEEKSTAKIFEKICEIFNVNEKPFILQAAKRNENGNYEFLLDVSDLRIPQGVAPLEKEVIPSKGKSLSEAFFNIDKDSLQKANTRLMKSYQAKCNEIRTIVNALKNKNKGFMSKVNY